MPKQSQLEKAIANIDAQIRVLELARQHLEDMGPRRSPKPVAKPRPVGAQTA